MGSVDADYRLDLDTRGGRGPFSWRLDGSLPPGLFFRGQNASSTLIAGRPEAGGVYEVDLQVTDGQAREAAVRLSVRIEPVAGTVSIVTGRLPPVTAVRYEARLEAWAGEGPFRWFLDTGPLPAGLDLVQNGSRVAFLRGDLVLDGRLNRFVVSVEDGTGTVDSQRLELPVPLSLDRPRIAIVTQQLPEGQVGVPYRAAVATQGGRPPVAFRTDGPYGPPPGLALSIVAGNEAVLEGTPTEAGNYLMTVEARDADGVLDDAGFSVVVRPSP